jgi:hypothetical protein
VSSYKYPQYLQFNDSAAFDALFNPGAIAVNAGIYRCTVCGDEIAVNKNTLLPPQNHHQHAPRAEPIRWQLIVFAVQRQ